MTSPEVSVWVVDTSLILKQGKVKMKSRKFGGMWKQRWIALYAPSSMGPTRLVKYSDRSAAKDDKPLSQFYMQDVTTVVRMAADNTHGITLSLSGGDIRQFICLNEAEAEDWLQKLQLEAGKTDILPNRMFRVYLLPSMSLNFSGECVVEMTSDRFMIYEDYTRQMQVARWFIEGIRKYAKNDEKKHLMIECGRGQEGTGEGIYLLRTIDYVKLYDTLHLSARHLRGSIVSSTSSSSQASRFTNPRPSVDSNNSRNISPSHSMSPSQRGRPPPDRPPQKLPDSIR